MRKLLKFALVGGTVGVAVAVVSSSRSDQSEDVTGQAVLVGGSVAALGAGVGFLFDRRARRKAKRTGRIEVARDFATDLVDQALPALEKTARRARKGAAKAAAQAREALADHTPIVVKVA